MEKVDLRGLLITILLFDVIIFHLAARASGSSNDTTECIPSTDLLGMKYQGTKSITISGKTCQKWIEDTYHKRNYWPENPEEHLNYCRNPDGDSIGVWCYTTDPSMRYERCDVPLCSTEESTANTTECILDNDILGQRYQGTKSVTVSGKTCQAWTEDTYHKRQHWPTNPENHSNYCRNPDGDSVGVWCYTTDPNKRWERCEVEICPGSGSATDTTECILSTDKLGMRYRGFQAVTASGIPCQKWTLDIPHKRNHWPTNPEDHSNYCRNPDGDSVGVWCYTTDPNKRWEKCEVKMCPGSGSATDTTECIASRDKLGMRYRGFQTVTASGLTCQKWTSDTPHKRIHWPTNPEEHSNYCRNPDADSVGVWCYTTDPNTRWERCDVPDCIAPDEHRLECLPDDDLLGIEYNGTLHTTITGRTCQKWTSNIPHKRYFFPPNPGEHSNYCRNPDGDESGLWCYTTDPNFRFDNCEVPHCSTHDTDDCFVCDGMDYRGKINVTLTGKNCQRWDSRTPHKHKQVPSHKPNRGLDENYCRNPDGELRPWCVTTDPDKEWDYCDVPRCRNADGSLKVKDLPYSTECMNEDGKNYRGTKSTTVTGKHCVTWTSSWNERKYPCSGLESNYCRSPLYYLDGIWCFTEDGTVEYCDVPKCATGRNTTGNEPHVEETTRSPEPSESPLNHGTCGTQTIQPSFRGQNFNIVGGKLVPRRRRKRIIGGEVSVHGSWPWMVSLRTSGCRSHFCGGILFKSQWIVTAAHCLGGGVSAKYRSVLAGHHDGSEPERQCIPFHEYYLNPKYVSGPFTYDIALVKVKYPFTFTDYVKPACLPTADYIVPGGINCVATGWGTNYENEWRLKQTIMPVHSYLECTVKMGFRLSDEAQMCVGVEGSGNDICPGDSGGPVMCLVEGRWTVQGVAAWAYSCKNRRGYKSAFSRVSKYMDWIERIVAENTP